MNKIKEFLGNNPLQSVEANREEAGRLLCEELGWTVFKQSFKSIKCNDLFYFPPSMPEYFEYSHLVVRLTYELSLIAEAEKAVIEKVGEDMYYSCLAATVKWLQPKNVMTGGGGSCKDSLRCKIATASALQRLTAMLCCLAEVEDKKE